MATDKKISELPDASLPIATGVKFEALQGGVNVKVDASDMPGSGASVPDADATTKGIAKLYTSPGSDTDGSMDRNSITVLANTKLDRNLTVKTKTANHTLDADDLTDLNLGKDILFLMNVASANTFTVPPNATIDVDAGGHIYIMRIGLGQTTFVQGAGVTIASSAGNLLDPGANALMPLIQTANDTWYLNNGTGGLYVSWNPGFIGFSANPSSPDFTYAVIGEFVHVRGAMGNGTSNTTTFQITGCPVAPRTTYNTVMLIMNNGATATGRVDIAAGGTTWTLYATAAAGAFTASGNKNAYVSLIFELQ